MKRIGSISLAGAAALLSFFCTAQIAEAADGSHLCALKEVLECSPGTGCERVSTGEVGLPDFLRVDPEGGRIRSASAGDERETAARSKEVAEGSVILVGIENRGWSAVLSEDGRRLVGTTADAQGVFVIFGVCTKD